MRIRVAIIKTIGYTVQPLTQCAQHEHARRHGKPFPGKRRQFIDRVALAEKMSANIAGQYLELFYFGVGL